MSKSSPGVQRVVTILNFFADHPGQSYTFSDLVRALKLSRATCHALLSGLVEAGYLHRTSEKSYVIGPALMRIARVANEEFSPLQIVRPEIRALADEFDATCLVASREADVITISERAASVSHLGATTPVGARMKLRPPFGAIYYAWKSSEEAEAWIDAVSPPATQAQRSEMLKAMRFALKYGFVFGVMNKLSRSAPLPPAEVTFSGHQREMPVSVSTDIEAHKKYALGFVVAPIFDVDREIIFTLVLDGFGGARSGSEVLYFGRRVREVCDKITQSIGGKLPQNDQFMVPTARAKREGSTAALRKTKKA